MDMIQANLSLEIGATTNYSNISHIKQNDTELQLEKSILATHHRFVAWNWEDGQRKTQASFKCANQKCESHKKYKYGFNADFNAARNIAMSTLFMEDGEVTEKKKEEAREYYGIKKENSKAVWWLPWSYRNVCGWFRSRKVRIIDIFEIPISLKTVLITAVHYCE